MHISASIVKQHTYLQQLGLSFLIIFSICISVEVNAETLDECFVKQLKQVNNDTTVGEIKRYCQQQEPLHSVPQVQNTDQKLTETEQAATTIVSDRLSQDKTNTLKPFTLMSHKPNYLLLGAYNSKGYDTALFEEQYNQPNLSFDDIEAQFQISIKVPLAINLFDTFDLYAAYTNRSFWQVYNAEISRPFRETNHEPEVWAQFTPGWKIFGFTNSANAIGIVHQSNGQGGLLSRSWNRVYANFVLQKGQFALGFKPWYRIPESSGNDDNPDIDRYLGHFELRGGYKWNEHVFSVMSRNNLESGFKRGTIELGWVFPLGQFPYLNGYVQYFNGYGESLIDYNHKVNRIGIGISLTDWL